jgi:restriction endonuclease Mrr
MPNVTLPSTQKFLHAILQYLKAYPEGVRRRDIYYGVADVIPLSGEQRHATTQNGIPKHHYRSGFSLGILRSSNLIENPEFGVWRITKEGLALLAEQPRELNVSTAQELIALSKNGTLENDKAEETTPLNPVAPEERLETALMDI